MSKLGDIAYITKLAGFEHSKYIQGNISHTRDNVYDTPLFIGKTVRNGKIDKNYDWYLPKKISKMLPRSQLTKKCLVMPYVGSLGDLAIFEADELCHLGSNIAKIELNDNANYTEEFIYYFIKSPLGQNLLFKDVQGAVQKNITMESIRNIELPNVSIDTQNTIVKILSLLDDKISLNNSICADLEAMAKQLYDYWFVQFDFPNENGKPYKSSGGKMVWNEVLKREIPEGWKVDSFKTIASFTMGQSPKGDNYNLEGKGLPLLNGAVELAKDGIHIGKYTEEYNRVCEAGEWLFCVRATLGNIHLSDQKYCLGRGVASAKPIRQETKEHVYYVLNGMISYFEKSLSGSIIIGMTKDDIIEYPIIIPPNGLISHFNSRIKDVFTKIEKAEEENQQLTSLRDFLLPMLMNGQITIKKH